MTVEAEGGDLIENDPTFHTDVDKSLFDKLPLESQSSSLSYLVTLATPGISADSNGLFHGLGDHAENSFSVDGQPITDQQSKIFSNQIPLDSIQSMEVIAGAPPAEYGDKTSVVINVDHALRTGRDDAARQRHCFLWFVRNFHRSSSISAYGGQNWGNFISVERFEQRAIPRSTGVCRPARQGQRRECVRPRGLSDHFRRIQSI